MKNLERILSFITLRAGLPDLPDFPENFRIFPVSKYILYDE
jgi:hypothetical protein